MALTDDPRTGLGAIYVHSLGVRGMSDWGARVANFVFEWFSGFTRVGDETARTADWSSPVEVVLHLGTVLDTGLENDLLTRLVVLSHAHGVGVRLVPCTPYAFTAYFYAVPATSLAERSRSHLA